MTFRQAMDALKARYGNQVVVSIMVQSDEDGNELNTVFAHGGGKCASAETYAGAVAALNALHTEVTEAPEIDYCPNCNTHGGCRCDELYESARERGDA